MSPKIFVGVPCYRSELNTNFVSAFVDVLVGLSAAGVGVCVSFVSGTLVGAARNELAAAFLKTDCTHLLYVDGDIGGFTGADIGALLASSFDVAAIACPVRAQRDAEPVRFAVQHFAEDLRTGKLSGHSVNGRTFIKVQDVGTGAVLIKRSVFERLIEAGGDAIRYTSGHATHPEPRHDIWGVGGPDLDELDHTHRKYIGEDNAFCRRWGRLGGEVWVLADVRITHMGPATISAAYLEHLQAGSP